MANELLDLEPYVLAKDKKTSILNKIVKDLTVFHYENCVEYKRMIDAVGFNVYGDYSYSKVPALPVSLFKELNLKSISDDRVFKTMTSSGTTGQAVSKIYLDSETAAMQQKVLVKIINSYMGASRLPMIIIDSPSVIKDRKQFSARGAGILGFSIFGTDKTYALDDNMELNIEALNAFLEKHKGERILLFGFTFMIWQHFYKKCLESDVRFDISNGILFHGGGWKKLVNEQVSKDVFKKALNDVCGIKEVHDYYGMVEQTGCVYVECERGHLHASNFSDIIIRNHLDLHECGIGEKGLIEVVSSIPKSYPGHVLLTEDEGVLLGEDDCPCGRKGKYFEVLGRIKNAEIRGCSDTYAAKFK